MDAAASVLVFGGGGFIGSRILEILVKRGVRCIAVSRRGACPKHLLSGSGNKNTASPWASEVRWHKGDATLAETYAAELKSVDAVVCAVGSPPLPTFSAEAQAKQRAENGAPNVVAIETSQLAGVSRVVLIGATLPAWAPSGYAQGKADAAAAAESFAAAGGGAVLLKPGAVYGTRHTAAGTALPLGLAMGPVSLLMRTGVVSGLTSTATRAMPYLLDGALVPPVSVDQVALAAADAAQDPRFATGLTTITNAELHEWPNPSC